MKCVFQERHGSNPPQESSQPCLQLTDLQGWMKSSLPVCSVPGIPTSQHHRAIPSRLPVPVKPHHRRARLAGPSEAIVASIPLSWSTISCFSVITTEMSLLSTLDLGSGASGRAAQEVDLPKRRCLAHRLHLLISMVWMEIKAAQDPEEEEA